MKISVRELNRNRNIRRGRRYLNRRIGRLTTRMLGGARRPRRTNYLLEALLAGRRAIRAHRKLIKLAPERFDFGLIERAKCHQAARDAVQAELMRALHKVYGSSESGSRVPEETDENEIWYLNGVEMVQKYDESGRPDGFRRRTAHRAKQLLEEEEKLDLWLSLAHVAMEAYARNNSKRTPSLKLVAALLDIGDELGRLASGRWKAETPKEKGDTMSDDPSALSRALDRAYARDEREKARESEKIEEPLEEEEDDYWKVIS